MNVETSGPLAEFVHPKPGGQLVSIALNGQTFTAETPLRYAFLGLHRPALIEVFFPSEATSLIVLFDSQPTNRAGMNGLEPCSHVLDGAATIGKSRRRRAVRRIWPAANDERTKTWEKRLPDKRVC